MKLRLPCGIGGLTPYPSNDSRNRLKRRLDVVAVQTTPSVHTCLEQNRPKPAGGRTFLLDSALEPDQVADEVVKGLAAERFLILPHPEVAEYFRQATDYDRWLRDMRKLRAENK